MSAHQGVAQHRPGKNDCGCGKRHCLECGEVWPCTDGPRLNFKIEFTSSGEVHITTLEAVPMRPTYHLWNPSDQRVLCHRLGADADMMTPDLQRVTCERCLRLTAALVLLGVEFVNTRLPAD